jgi:hypothetical protein
MAGRAALQFECISEFSLDASAPMTLTRNLLIAPGRDFISLTNSTSKSRIEQ